MIKKSLAVLVAVMTLVTSLGISNQASANFPDGDGAWADAVVSFLPKPQADGNAIPSDLQNAWQALGPSEWDGVTPTATSAGVVLGFKGQVTLKFDNAIVNTKGKDFRVYTIHDGTNPFVIGKKSYYKYRAKVEVSQNCWNWKTVGVISGDASLDLGPLNWANCVQITDISWKQYYYPTATGFRLESVQALHTTTSKPWAGQTYDIRWWKIDGDATNDVWQGKSLIKRTGTGFCQNLWSEAITFHNNFVTNSVHEGTFFQDAVYNTAGRSPVDGMSMTQIHDRLEGMTCNSASPRDPFMNKLTNALYRISKGRDLWYQNAIIQ